MTLGRDDGAASSATTRRITGKLHAAMPKPVNMSALKFVIAFLFLPVLQFTLPLDRL